MTELAKAHLETLSSEHVDPAGRLIERPALGDFVTFFLLPVVVGLVLWRSGVKAPNADPLLSAIAILTGLLFALLVLMFERIAHERGELAPASGNDPLADAWRVLANVSWAILVSLGELVVLFTATLYTTSALPSWLTGIVVGIFAHLVLTLLMVLKRVFLMAMRIAGYRRLSPARR